MLEKIIENSVDFMLLKPLDYFEKVEKNYKKNQKIKNLMKRIEKDGKFRRFTLNLEEFLDLLKENKLKLSNEKVSLNRDQDFEINLDLFDCIILNSGHKNFRKFSLKGFRSEQRNNVITIEFIGEPQKMKLQNIYYTGRNGMKLKIRCVNDIPQYHENEEFVLTKKYGNMTSGELMKMFGKDFMKSDLEVFDENNETEVYFNPYEYFSNFRWFAYERIGKYIVRKWSRGYEATADFYLEEKGEFDPDKYSFHKNKKNPLLTISSMINNRYKNATRYLSEGFELFEFTNWIEGYCANDEDYKKYGFDKLLGIEKSTFSQSGELAKMFSFAKIKLKKSELKIPEGHKENEEIGANFYPVRIEFLDENFETLGIITFDKFTIATFEGFKNYKTF
jgi:hypothetical protein